jgi:predicted transcriptional regulator
MHGAYDQTFSLMHSSSEAFLKAQNRILHLIKCRAKVNKLNSQFLYRTNDFNKKTSIAVRQFLCPKCPEDRELCEEDRDPKRRYYCKALSQATGDHVRLYFPSQNDIDNRKEQLKRAIMQTVAWDRGASQTRIIGNVRGDWKLVRECLNELAARGLLRCSERTEQNKQVKRYSIVFD